jgi:hypothetical protein
MTIEVSVDLDVEIPPDVPYLDLRERARAACASISLLQEHGFEVEEGAKDKETAASLLAAYASNADLTSQKVTHVRAAALTPASLVHIRNYLDEYGRVVVAHAVELRHTVTNRLLEESQNPDPRIRIRALELLGKISDVGLFTDRSEVTVTHQSTDELRAKLREKLVKLTKPVQSVQLGGEIIDVDAELGLKPPKGAESEEKVGQLAEILVPESEVGVQDD